MAHLLLLLPIYVLVVVWLNIKFTKKHPPLPPSPPAEPVIGHLRLIPPNDKKEMFFYDLGKKYGAITHLKVPGQTLIVLNSYQMAMEILDKRGVIYSGRPRFPLAEIVGFVQSLVFLDYGTDFRLHRRMMQKYFVKDKILEHHPIQIREARVLARNLVMNTGKREDLFVRFATAIIIETAYGHQIIDNDDPYLKMAEDLCNYAVPALTPPEGSAVEALPFLQHFPSWFPGTHYAYLAKNARKFVTRLYEYPLSDIKEKMAKGTAKSCFLVSQLDEYQNGEAEKGITIEHIQGASASLYAAGTETTSSTLAIFVLTMLLHPECQRKAQEEIDAVIGPGRLPDFNDRDSLPYLECILHETHRWHPTVPLGIPHLSLEDDVYEGMYIPKGSIVIANVRGMTLDENVYHDPFIYDPTRFLPKPQGRGEPYPTAAFGFGRRTCPGRHIASDSLWIAIATMIATLSISKVIDDSGKKITPEAAFTLGVTSNPRPFPCRIEPRHEMARSLLAQISTGNAK